MKEDYEGEIYKDSTEISSNNYYFTSGSINTLAMKPMCFTFYCGKNKTITLGPNKVTYEGFENADEATLAFLNKLVEIYPSWKENLKNEK